MNNISQLLLDTYFGDQDSILVLGDYCEENNVYFQGLINSDVEESLADNLNDRCYDGNHYHYHSYDDGNDNGNGYGDGDYGYDIGKGKEEFYL